MGGQFSCKYLPPGGSIELQNHKKVQDIKNVLELEENTGLYELIMPSDENIDGLVNTLTKNGYEKPKTNEEINDVQWGVIVRLGNTIGIEDEEVLASQT
ncbi:hypothetical protein Dacet_1640 [Denitrovibrio acetiphilus DSM 12809]|uniref:Uncharacterized protein n=1 Tax=Denitrovibrio acetiphilus (strain DSM 12809 / NBRC 114555 / N2460) TaxID=522772 RepID=D4H8Q7_DENA2|nr:hypothetical protein [Denitrovibrio acetiphilus]ADD68406.1 hypothetical protein Dacet_1640 [Denitrovibrio acetiphilus DSM 12809]